MPGGGPVGGGERAAAAGLPAPAPPAPGPSAMKRGTGAAGTGRRVLGRFAPLRRPQRLGRAASAYRLTRRCVPVSQGDETHANLCVGGRGDLLPLGHRAVLPCPSRGSLGGYYRASLRC